MEQLINEIEILPSAQSNVNPARLLFSHEYGENTVLTLGLQSDRLQSRRRAILASQLWCSIVEWISDSATLWNTPARFP